MRAALILGHCLLAGSPLLLPAADSTPSANAFFESKVLPVLQNRCYECHSHEKKIKGGLALDSKSGWERGGDTGPAVKPGDVEKSLLITAVRYTDSDLQMPTKGKLADAEIAILEEWVKRGAPDTRVADATQKKRTIDIPEGKKFWAFKPVANPATPRVKDRSWALDPLDHFILTKLEQASLHPVADADLHTWLRRVSLDLTGLPPTPDQVQAFIQSATGNRQSAMENVVDRLLASKAFGERWARHWLDLTGYADQVGTSNDVFAEHAWRYRDYLIDALNADRPFDRFIREQIAGDLLPFKTPQERAQNITATGFLVLGDIEIVNPDKLKMETDHIDQQVSKVGMAFLGMTLGCVRCHDHKFDPIAQEDYYAIAGMFRSTVSTRRISYGIWSGINVVGLPETAAQSEERKRLEEANQKRLDGLKSEQAQLTKDKTALDTELAKPVADKDALTKRRDAIGEKLKKLARDIEHAEFFVHAEPMAFATQDAEKTGDMQITIRGNPYAPGALVPRGMVRVASWKKPSPIPAGQSGRLQLADWLSDRHNPLTARVTVNRIWQKLFGEGIVRSVDYFGVRGEAPSHPELLDHLATRFMRDGWSQKKLIRSLVLSHTYRMGSGHDALAEQKDPENRLLWRMNRQRLDAEALRDAMLAVSGQLKPFEGGPSLPLEFVENTGGLKPKGVNPPSFSLKKFRPEQEFQRTIYLPIIRSAQAGPARLRDVFDFTQPAQMAGMRAQTVVPTQALFLLNNDLMRQRAGGLSKSLKDAAPDRVSRIDALWLRVLNRPVTVAEREDAIAFLDKLKALMKDNPDAENLAWLELCHTLLSSNEFIYRL
ncbi:MAG TPA: PSD1 and planctomycete cytochrome C domain-containing protein [Roseimicrobium sp.]|nr:PSD1 and planctomycete cytochrome C domain-containing protein [Roseimicrobium sp.]